LARNTLWTLVGQVARVLASGITFVFVARALGPEQMGAFIAVSAVMWIVAPFSGLGFGMLLLQRVARDRGEYPTAFGEAIAATLISGAALLLVATVGGQLILPSSIPLELFLTIGLVELIFSRLIEICGQSFQAHARMRESSAMQVLLSVARLLAAGLLLQSRVEPTATTWTILQLGSTVIASGAAMIWTIGSLGRPTKPLWKAAQGARTGVFFSIGLAAQSIYNDIDKAMLSRLVSLSAAGVYGAAYKLVELVFAPVRSLLLASASTLFARGAEGAGKAYDYSRRLIPIAAAYALVAGASILLLAPVAPVLLGPEYADAVSLIRALALLPILKVTHSFAADTLGASGHQSVRSAVQLGIAGTNVVLNLLILPAFGLWGAVATSLACELLLGVAMWTALHRAIRDDARRGAAA
jgi:O-antigen/teichoic acid export membrane protein